MSRSDPAWLLAVVLILSGTISSAGRADDTPAPPSSAASGPKLRDATQAANSEDSAVTLRLQYTGEGAYNVMGGLHDGATYLNNVLGQLHIDTGLAFGLTGGSIALEGYYENADSLDTHYVGAIQDPSVIDTSGVNVFRLYQAYYRQDLDNTTVLFGIYDLETAFGITKPMDIFFNGAYAWTMPLDQSGVNGPSTYPVTALALRVQQRLSDQWSVQAAIADGVPDSAKDPKATAVNINKTNGAFLIAEADYTPTRTTKIMAGFWDYTGKFPALNQFNADGSQRQIYDSYGGYIGGATRIYSPEPRRGLDAFANLGIARADTQVVEGSLNAGLVYTGLLGPRPRDRLGFAVGIARAGDPYRQMQIAAGQSVETYETNFELTYRAPITSWLVVQPDVQYWINPAVDPRLKNDLLFLVHFELSHVFGL